jgi:hypothetical protein
MNLDPIKLQRTVDEFVIEVGIDSLELCKDPIHFKNYSKNVIYKFNQLGYRDEEWPDDISGNIWAVGDSFTVGLGQPVEETWCKLVEKRLNNRVINVSMNGASNSWIARRIQFILDNFNPTAILVQWSYLHRREHPDNTLLDEDRALHFDVKLIKTKEDVTALNQLDVQHLLSNIRSIQNKNNVTIIHSFIPKFYNNDAKLAEPIYKELEDNNVDFFPELEQLDYARDCFHYDIITATQYAETYIKKLQERSITI